MGEFFEKRTLTGNINITLSTKKKWSADKQLLCAHIVNIVDEYSKAGYRMSLRQLYYQLVTKNVIVNDIVVYNKLSSILEDLRICGIVDWDAIEDRGRIPYLPYTVKDPLDALNDTIRTYRINRQQEQPILIEVWTEKDAISGILKRVTSKYHIKLVVNKGYSSNSAMHAAYTRFAAALTSGQDIRILYFGDHDPSGLDMIRDIRERIIYFLATSEKADDYLPDPEYGWGFEEWYRDENNLMADDLVDDGYLSYNVASWLACNNQNNDRWEDQYEKLAIATRKYYWNTRFKVIPIGLTYEQVLKYNPPINPAKVDDPRAKEYIKTYGQKSWEVDALEPKIMVKLITEGIEAHMDTAIYNKHLQQEKNDIEVLKKFVNQLK